MYNFKLSLNKYLKVHFPKKKIINVYYVGLGTKVKVGIYNNNINHIHIQTIYYIEIIIRKK